MEILLSLEGVSANISIMKHKKDQVFYLRVWHGQVLYSGTSDMSIITLITEGDCTITLTKGDRTVIEALRVATLEVGREIRVPKGSDAVFGNNKAHVMLIHRA
jgi:hypothetical protein